VTRCLERVAPPGLTGRFKTQVLLSRSTARAAPLHHLFGLSGEGVSAPVRRMWGEARIALASESPVPPPRRDERECEQDWENRKQQRVRERRWQEQHRRQEQCRSGQAE
jgi:hypothetical protein